MSEVINLSDPNTEGSASGAINLSKLPSAALYKELSARGIDICNCDGDGDEPACCDFDNLPFEVSCHIDAARAAIHRKDDREMLHQLYLALGVDFWRLKELAEGLK